MNARPPRLALLLALTAGPLLAEPPAMDLLQPTVGRQGLVLETAVGRARVERNGATARIAVRPDELLTTIAETRAGWTAAGIRESIDRTELVVMREGQAGFERLPDPDSHRHPLRLRPTLLVQHEDLAGLAWLEGPDVSSLSVRAASWSDERWESAEVVSPTARGSQTGLVGAVLLDGSRLLVWSTFDGRDDELFWSRGLADSWSPPQRLAADNSEPDVMPDLLVTPESVWLAWSRLIDGHYRLLLSRFEDGSWSPPRLAGPPGSLEPRFTYREGRAHLVFRNGWPAAWAVLELTAGPAPRRWAVFAEPGDRRPVVIGTATDAVELRWPDGRRRAARWEMAE